jgi:uncharacterized membrane protein YkvA (DUF1232 family)
MGKFVALSKLLKMGRLALRLLRDSRVPPYVKVVPILAVLYLISPIDILPDIFPVLGQLDDVAILAAGLQLFIKLCPDEVVEEHEASLDRRPPRTVEGFARPVQRP